MRIPRPAALSCSSCTKPLTGVDYTLIEPNSATFLASAVGWAGETTAWQNFGFAFSDGSMFFTHPEQTGTNPWTLRWDLPDGERCSTTFTMTP